MGTMNEFYELNEIVEIFSGDHPHHRHLIVKIADDKKANIMEYKLHNTNVWREELQSYPFDVEGLLIRYEHISHGIEQ